MIYFLFFIFMYEVILSRVGVVGRQLGSVSCTRINASVRTQTKLRYVGGRLLNLATATSRALALASLRGYINSIRGQYCLIIVVKLIMEF